MDHQSLLYKIALSHIPHVGSVLARNLVSYCGGPEAVFREKKKHLLCIPGIGEVVASHIVNQSNWNNAEAEIAFIEQQQINAYFYLDDEYPMRLKRIKDAPVILYYKGNADLNAERILAIVGTRKPTNYGIQQCEKLVDGMSPLNVTIVSGLAYGIDITAHRRALRQSSATIGVLGSGLDHIYPSAHRSTAMQMIDSGGLLTEFGKGTLPDREHFPMRNRIIAGMSDAIVVVESDLTGGSMITADLANGYHKDVFAFPGRVDDQRSRGCNLLIRSARAHLLQNADELAETMQWDIRQNRGSIQRALFTSLSDREQAICKILDNRDPVSIDRLYKESGYTASEMASLLLELEFKGVIKALPGKLFMLIS